jgi:hypothetical protein
MVGVVNRIDWGGCNLAAPPLQPALHAGSLLARRGAQIVVSAILSKLQVTKRRDAVTRARELGTVS